ILDGQYDAAETILEKALAVNPASMQALANQASIHHLRSDTAAFAAVEQQALAINARAGDFYVAINENLTLRFRYPEAVAYGRKGVQVDPGNARALAALGASLMRVGQAREARRYLDRSFDRDPFNLFVGNTLELLDAYAEFVFLESEHFRLLIHSDESAVLGPAMLDEAEACYAALSARFPYQPEDKILIEAYNDRGDFDVRVAGVPHIGLLGVSFGDVIALNTPKAQAGRPYNWARTLWHELAHTMAIGVSKHHVPRWFTEGLSVYEEQRARPEWGREMDLEFFTAFDRDKLHRLEEIDRGFTRPEFPGQILLSYYHASKVIAFIVDQYSFQAIIDILVGLGQGLDQEAVFRQVLGQSRNALDTAFRAELQQRRDQFDQVLAGLPDMLGDEEVSLLEKLTGRSENPFLRRLQEGHAALEQADFSTAETRFREALEIYPDYVGSGNPYLGLATVYRERDDEARLIDILEQFLSVSEYGPAEARELGALYADADDTDQALAYLARSLEVEPYDLPTRDRLAVLYEQQGRYAQVVQQRRAILALNPVDKANAYYELARSLYNTHDVAAAKRAVLQSLERAPGYREAQKLLLDFVDNMP
ncbi:MAG: peptidase MA family metallohydrolase, partial [Rhodothermales bacterium]